MGKQKLKIMTCSKCGHTWRAYSENPKRCPECHAYLNKDLPKIKTLCF